ncbi:helix-turn-helix domain-containing protein [Nocardiopsis halophila]
MAARPGHPHPTAEHEHRFWSAVRRGADTDSAAAAAGVSPRQARARFRRRGGVTPPARSGQRTRALGFAEREETALLHAQRRGVRETARRPGRDPGTVSRELRRVPPYPTRALTAAVSDAKASLASPSSIRVPGAVYSSLSIPA